MKSEDRRVSTVRERSADVTRHGDISSPSSAAAAVTLCCIRRLELIQCGRGQVEPSTRDNEKKRCQTRATYKIISLERFFGAYLVIKKKIKKYEHWKCHELEVEVTLVYLSLFEWTYPHKTWT